MLAWEEHKSELKRLGADIETLAEAVFIEFMARLRRYGYDNPRGVLDELLSEFDGEYKVLLSAAITTTLQQSISVSDVSGFRIGRVTLTNKLIRNHKQTAANVERIIKNHAKSWKGMQKLATELYDGYTGEQQPLEWSPRNKKLPLYIRNALQDRPTRAAMARITRKGVMDTMKTPALRAAYSELLAKAENTTGMAALEKKLNVAMNERMRFQANRIAQTEMHRTWATKQAQELLDNDDVEVVIFRLSSTHPSPDICDIYARQDLYGLGEGVYPKANAPSVPLHPFCRCRLQGSITKKADGAKKNNNAQKELMQSIAKQDAELARKIAGSKAKLEAMLKGKTIESLYNAGKPDQYHIGRELSSLDF